MKKILFVMLIALSMAFSVHLYGLLAGNESCIAFTVNGTSSTTQSGGAAPQVSEDPCETITGTSSSMYSRVAESKRSLGYYIAKGGGSFLDSSGHFSRFLGLVESSEIEVLDFEKLREYLDSAIAGMESTNQTYGQLAKLAASMPYNQAVLYRLAEFDYYEFQKKKQLLPSIFKKVQRYLVFGNVRGVYREFQGQTDYILSALYELKKDVDAGILPAGAKLWRLNQKYSEFKLFGQYVAEVFYELKK